MHQQKMPPTTTRPFRPLQGQFFELVAPRRREAPNSGAVVPQESEKQIETQAGVTGDAGPNANRPAI